MIDNPWIVGIFTSLIGGIILMAILEPKRFARPFVFLRRVFSRYPDPFTLYSTSSVSKPTSLLESQLGLDIKGHGEVRLSDMPLFVEAAGGLTIGISFSVLVGSGGIVVPLWFAITLLLTGSLVGAALALLVRRIVSRRKHGDPDQRRAEESPQTRRSRAGRVILLTGTPACLVVILVVVCISFLRYRTTDVGYLAVGMLGHNAKLDPDPIIRERSLLALSGIRKKADDLIIDAVLSEENNGRSSPSALRVQLADENSGGKDLVHYSVDRESGDFILELELLELSPGVYLDSNLLRKQPARALRMIHDAASQIGGLLSVREKMSRALAPAGGRTWSEATHAESRLVDAVVDMEDRELENEALRWVGTPKFLDVLRDALGSVSPRRRKLSAELIGSLGPADWNTERALEARLEDEYPAVRAAAAEALGRIGSQVSPLTLRSLAEALEDEDKDVRVAAARAVVAVDGSVPDTKLRFAMDIEDKSSWTRYHTVRALGSAANLSPYRRAVLIRALKDEEWWVRYAAVRALERFASEDGKITNALAKGLEDSSWLVRYAVVDALGSLTLQEPEIKHGLYDALNDDHWWVRREVVIALGEFGKGVEFERRWPVR
jgi:HEAT repeat protein